MKKILKVLGIIFLVIVILIASLFAYTYLKSSEYNEEALPYIEKVIPELSTWNTKILKKYSAPEALANIKDEEFEKLMRWFSKLGNLKSIEKPKFVNFSNYSSLENGQKTILSYTILAHYENGDALIEMSLLEVENGFQVYRFHLNSSALID